MEGEAAAKWMLITASLRARACTLASCVSGALKGPGRVGVAPSYGKIWR